MSSAPEFCAACKSHEPYVAEYRKTAHSDANCEQCHTKPGPFFFLTAKLEALQQPVHQLTGDYEEPILGTVLNQACRRCHTDNLLFGKTNIMPVLALELGNCAVRRVLAAGSLCIRDEL